MGGASLIGSAIALVLLILTAYIVIGGILSTTEIVSVAQSDQFHQLETRMRTAIEITDATIVDNTTLYIHLTNSGGETLLKYKYFDVYTLTGTSVEPVYYSYVPPAPAPAPTAGEWTYISITPDLIHPNELDPGEVMNISVKCTEKPTWIQITTGNGVYDSVYL
ncbi:MAG: hypothetical protein U9N40_01660 [Euryarchaeota archaeon]|nr:hypothetical protein [Euryarchaeota archaeon]